ncbi:MAG: helix-turn-helix domain-containing protein [Ruminococcaceae bacterium]|nr:helix-turn-helix domain-containing protein [Oscillospiraceae bacterium]
MSIGRNIYELRRNKKMTQGQLAEKLGVTEQSVSKWENGICAPDVSLFPTIAGFFGVSIDRIFGYSETSYDDEVEKIRKECDNAKDTYEEIEILSKGLERYPNSAPLKTDLAFSLSMINRISKDENEKKEAVQKGIRLCNEVVATCGDQKEVDNALVMLCRIYSETGEFEKALEANSKISPDNYYNMVIGKCKIFNDKNSLNEQSKVTEENLWKCFLAMDLILEMYVSALRRNQEFEKASAFVRAHKKLLSIFDEGCENFYAIHKFWAWNQDVRISKTLMRHEECLEKLKGLFDVYLQMRAAENSESFDVADRNPMFFSNTKGFIEEYGRGGNFDKNYLSKFDKFLEKTEGYAEFKEYVKNNDLS